MEGPVDMRISPAICALTAVSLIAPAAYAACKPGAYGSADNFVVVVSQAEGPQAGQRYLFLDGRRGNTTDADSPVSCAQGAALVSQGEGRTDQWPEILMSKTDTSFSSLETRLAGRLIEPVEGDDDERPLVVMVHGSERTSALNSTYAYALAAQGLAVFVYDKRGTGASEGEYTQNFELLAADASAALEKAKVMAADRYDRAGFFGGSQGGWVAPLAATRSRADFVAVGFGLVASPIDEDREEMIASARALKLEAPAIDLINRLSQATSRLLLSHFATGYEELNKVRRELESRPWWSKIRGEYSVDMARMSENDLRRFGRARFDNLELQWDYDSIGALKRLDAPLLWVLAEDDREAPIETTRAALVQLMREKKGIDVYVFPDTDHGMMEYVANPDGSRTMTHITNGYLKLLGDWIKETPAAAYGRGQKLTSG
jgi:pimeloyl-ACP methyl ester carboxylesterase